MKALRSHRGLKGFTLVEVLVVISIIALLLSILMPSLSAARERSKKLICKSNLAQASIAFKMYGNDHDDKIVPGNEWMYSVADSYAAANRSWHVVLITYLQKDIQTVNLQEGVNSHKVWICPADKDPYPKGFLNYPHEGFTSYALNGFCGMNEARDINGKLFFDVDTNTKLGPGGGFKFSDVKSPCGTMLLGETSYAGQIYDVEHPEAAGILNRPEGHHRNTSGFYHNETMNILYVDGHVGNFKGIKCQKDDKWIPKYITKQNGMFFPELRLNNADEKPLFWGPGYY